MHVQLRVRPAEQEHGGRKAMKNISMNDTHHGEPHNGMSTDQLPTVSWQKSRRSNPSGNCVELAILPGGAEVAVRNSRFPEGPALIYTSAEIAAFVRGAKDGDFDHLLG
jgi:hypothetical protein